MVRYAHSKTNVDFTSCIGYNAHGQKLGDNWVWRLEGEDFTHLPEGVALLPVHTSGAHRVSSHHKAPFHTVYSQPGDSLWDLIEQHSKNLNQTFHETHHP